MTCMYSWLVYIGDKIPITECLQIIPYIRSITTTIVIQSNFYDQATMRFLVVEVNFLGTSVIRDLS